MQDEYFDREEQRRRLKEETRYLEENRKVPTYIEREREQRRDGIRARIVGLAFVMTLFAAGLFYYHNYTYTTYSVDGETSLGALSGATLYQFGDGAVVIGNDTVTYLEGGEIVWTTSISLQAPVFVSEDDFFAVYDQGGYRVYICDATGLLSTVKVTRRIRGTDLSASGVTAVFTESDDAAYISYFDRFGSRLAVELKTVLNASGYPVHIAISPDGQKLAVVSYSTGNGIGESRLSVYDFEHGKKENNYIADTIDDFYDSGTFAAYCDFLDDTHLAVIGDRELAFSVYTDKRELITTRMSYKKPVRSVFTAGPYLGMVFETDKAYECVLYDTDGSVYSSFEVRDPYDEISVSDSYILFRKGADLNLYNLSGRHRYSGTLSEIPVSVSFSGQKSLLINNGNAVSQITFK